MAPRFTSFVILAGMRTGSNFLEANLNRLPGVKSYGEVFNPHFIGVKNQLILLGMDVAARTENPKAMLERMRQNPEVLTGFRLFHDHDPRVLDMVLTDPACAKIVLNRNPLESYVSLKVAQKTGQWKLTDVKHLKQATAIFDAQEFAAHLGAAQEFRLQVQHGLQTTGQSAFYIDYDDLQDIDVLNGLAQWLGIAGRLEAVDQTLKKQNATDLAVLVENSAELEAAAQRVDLFNLARSASYEPRRAPMVQDYVAAISGGLLFMPMRGGPQTSVADWLAQVGNGGIVENFTQRTLKDWRLAHPARRAFTVLRHPVARGWAVFNAVVRGEQLADLRQAMQQTYKVAIPDNPDDLVAMQGAFLSFLGFVKLSLAGQTGLRVPPHWASQGTILQGFAQLQSPDVVMREGDMAEGLARLAADVGARAPRYTPKADTAKLSLASIYDGDIEQGARDAWPRDYLMFGFAPWS